jgi:hypothetical protein
MEQYKIGNAVVRIHNEPNQDKIRTATERFLKQVQIQKKKGEKQNAKRHQQPRH